MSIIAVHGFPERVTLVEVVKKLAKPIRGNYEVLNFDPSKGKGKFKALKTCYIRLSDKLDPVRIVEQINSYNFPTKLQYKAYIPDEVPDLPLGKKPKKMPSGLRKKLHITEEETPEEMLRFATEEILLELQIKYPGLYSLSKRYDHKLLQNLTKKVFNRVKEIAEGSSEIDLCFKLTGAYRRAYPHFGDFQLVLSTHHEIQDSVGVPRIHLEEADIAATAPAPLAMNLPPNKLKPLRNRCADRVITEITNHIKSLDAEISPGDDEDQIARKQVRQELKKLLPFMPTIVNQMIDKHLMPKEIPRCRIRVYGEPFLPNKEVIGPFLAKFRPLRVTRSARMYNLMKFTVPPSCYHQLTAMNGTVLNGAKLIIRSAELAEYEGVQNALGFTAPQSQQEEDDIEEPMEEDQEDDWE